MKNIHEIEIELKGKEWTDILDNTFKKVQKELKLDGFRKGQVPKDMYIKKYGIESLYMDSVDDGLSAAYKKLLDNNKVIPVVEPKVDIKDISEDKVVYLFTIITEPEIKLGAYKNLKVKKEKVVVSKEEINNEIERIREQFAELVIVENLPVKKGHTAVVSFKGYVDGELLEGGTGENYPLEIGSNSFIPGFEEGLIGMKTNEEKEINLKFPEDYVEHLKNKDVVFKVKVEEIKERVLPELNKELYLDLGYEDVNTVEEFEAKIKEELNHRKEHENDDKYLEAVVDVAVKNLEVEVNEEIVNDEVNRMLEQFKEQLQYQGFTLEQYTEVTKTTEDDLKSQMKEDALKRIKTRYLLQEIVKKEKIDVTEEELESDIEKLATMHQATKEEIIKMFGGTEMIKYDSKMRKAIDILKNN